ncbi:MAG: PIN domain-containing protein [Rubrobacter sp.]
MNYLLDTNIASYVMRQRPPIVAKIEEVGGLELLSVSTVTLAELAFGIRVLPEGRKKSELLSSLERMLGTRMEVRPFSTEAAWIFSEAGATLRRAGVAFSFQDLAIASVAMAENKTLASNDGFFTDVQRLCGLRFERWEP